MEIQNNELSQENSMARMYLLAYSMVKSGRPIDELTAEYGISDEEFTGWLLDGSFAECASSAAAKMSGVYAPYFLHSLLKSAMDGSVPAMKLYFDVFGHKSDGMTSVSPEIEALRADIFGRADRE